MGFDVKKISDDVSKTEIIIPLEVNLLYSDAESKDKPAESAQVQHVFRMPANLEREKYQSLLVKVKNNSLKGVSGSTANFYLWSHCYIRLIGYDNLPDTREQIIKLFDESPVLRIHAENAGQALYNLINTGEGDTVKKSERSSEL
jgi:hypothetical protein